MINLFNRASLLKRIAFALTSFFIGFLLQGELIALLFACGFLALFFVGVIIYKHRPNLDGYDVLLFLFCSGVMLGRIFPLKIEFLGSPISNNVHGFFLGGALGIGGALGYLLTVDKVVEYDPVEPIIFNEILEAKDIFTDIEDSESGVTQDLIEITEKRLNIKIPKKLLTLYKIQNGGYLRDKMLFKDDENLYCFWQEPLLPMQKWVTAYDYFEQFNDPEDSSFAEWFTPKTKKIIVLLNDHANILFIDYNEVNRARVGYAQEHWENGWYENVIWWSDCQEFLDSLRRYEEGDEN